MTTLHCRFSQFLSVVLLLLISLTVSVFAHPGRTDSRGGHYDRSTGIYHYHHGYPAHQHTDGVCPYNFDDKTNHSSSSGGTYSNSTKSKYEEPVITYVEPLKKQQSSKESTAYVIMLLFVFLSPFLIGALYWVITAGTDKFKEYIKYQQNIKEQARKAELERQQKLERERKEREERAERARQQIEERERQRQAEKEQKRQEFLKEKELMTQKYGGKPISDFVNIPDGSTIGADNLPREINAVKDWGDKYTFYQQKDHAYRPELNHYKYHKKTCHYAPLFSPINAYELKSRINQRCMLCQPVLPDMEWVDEYRKIQEIKKKYDIE